MKVVKLRCVNCGQEVPPGLRYHCASCRYPLEVIYEAVPPGEPLETSGKPGIWRYQPCLPAVGESDQVSLGEGNTPLIPAPRLGRDLGIPSLFVKDEGQNPTGSFKDRPTALGVSLARFQGCEVLAASSTGNAGASLAAYAARAGLPALIFVPERTPPAKLAQMVLHGARIIPVRGSVSDAFWLAYHASIQRNWMNLTSTFLNPYTVEGNKTAAYELFQQLGQVPDWIVIPVSVGPMLVGVYKGFLELKGRGLVDRLPRMVAAQAAGCAPLAAAFARGEENVSPWNQPVETVAGGIADPLQGYERDGSYALRVLRQSGGLATASPDDEILAAMRTLARLEGISSEPTGAVGLAALSQLIRSPLFSTRHVVVCVVTGHGLKGAAALEQELDLPQAIDPSPEALFCSFDL